MGESAPPIPRDLPPYGIPDGQESKRQSETPSELTTHLGSEILMVVIVADHPHLWREDIYAAQEFTADYLADEQIAFA